MKADEILEQGANRLAEEGWCRGSYVGATHVGAPLNNEVIRSYCAMGAMRKVAFGYGQFPAHVNEHPNQTAYKQAEEALAEVMTEQFHITDRDIHTLGALLPDYVPNSFDIIGIANDSMAQSKDEVIACMEKAAVNLRGSQ